MSLLKSLTKSLFDKDPLDESHDGFSIERVTLIADERPSDALDRATEIFNCSNKLQQFRDDMAAVGLMLDEATAKFCLLVVIGLANIDVRSWARLRNLSLKGTTAVAYGADDTSTLLFSTLLQFLPPEKIEELSRCTQDFFIHAGGPTGSDLAQKTVFWRELMPSTNGRFTTKLDFILETTIHGYWRTGTISYEDDLRQSRMVTIHGPINHLFTTTATPQKFGKEFLHKSFWLNLGNLNDTKTDSGTLVQRTRATTWKTCELIRQSWQLLASVPGFKRLSPTEAKAFVDVDVPYLAELKIKDHYAEDLLLLLIASQTLLNQKQRRQYEIEDGRSVLVSEVEDFNAVLPVFLRAVKSETTASTASEEAFMDIYALLMKNGLTVQELEVELKKSTRTVRYYLDEWKQLNLIADGRKKKSCTVIEPGPELNRLSRDYPPNLQKVDFESNLRNHLKGGVALSALPSESAMSQHSCEVAQ